MKIKVTNNLSYPDAKKQYNIQNQIPTTHKTYAAAVAKPQITKNTIETQTDITWPINQANYSMINKSVQTQSTPLEPQATTVQTQQVETGTKPGGRGKNKPAARSKSRDSRGAGAPKGKPEVGSGASKPRTREKKGDPVALLQENSYDVLSDSTGDDMELDYAPTSPVRGTSRKGHST